MTYNNGHHIAVPPTEEELEAAKCLECGMRVDREKWGLVLVAWCHSNRRYNDDVWRRWFWTSNYWENFKMPPAYVSCPDCLEWFGAEARHRCGDLGPPPRRRSWWPWRTA